MCPSTRAEPFDQCEKARKERKLGPGKTSGADLFQERREGSGKDLGKELSWEK